MAGKSGPGPLAATTWPFAETTSTADVLVCEGLERSFGDRRAVDGVSFTIAPGETYGLLGPNGAGKTTTISMICGVLDADAGSVRIDGVPMGPRAVAAKRLVGYVPQEIALYPDLTGRENLRFFGRLQGLTGGRLTDRVDETLDLVGLVDRAEDRVDAYSGGMKRRLNIAAGMLHGPHLLVLDEPTVGVDPQSRNSILESVERLGREGLAVLYTTHYMEEAERLCDRVGIIDHGELVAQGTRRELVAHVGERDRVSVKASGDLEDAAEACRHLEGVISSGASEEGIALIVEQAAPVLPGLLQIISDHGLAVSSVEVIEPDLEAVFLHLTGRALRD